MNKEKQTSPPPTNYEFLKYAGLFLVSPYLEIWRRLKLNDLKILELLFATLCVLILLKYFFLNMLINFYYVNALLPLIFKPYFIIKWWKYPFFYLIFHVFYAVLRRQYINEGKGYGKGLGNLGFKDSDGNFLKYCGKYPLNLLTTVYRYENPTFSSKDFEDKIDRLKTIFKTPSLSVRYGEEKGEENRQIIEFICRKKGISSLFTYEDAQQEKLNEYEFIVGEDALAKRIILSLDRMLHLLISGETKCGKSSFFRQIIFTLLSHSKNIHFCLIDLKKGLEFNIFNNIKNIEVISDVETAALALSRLSKEVDKRFLILKKAEVENISAYEAQKKIRMPRIVIVIDEAANLFSPKRSPQIDPAIIQNARASFANIAAQARACGIHLIFASQQISKDSIPWETKVNFPTCISFKVNSYDASTNIIGNKAAYELEAIEGRAILKIGPQLKKLQTPYLSFSKAKELLAPFIDPNLKKEVSEKNPQGYSPEESQVIQTEIEEPK